MAGTMHLPIYKKMIYALVRDEVWNGESESPTGAFIQLVLEGGSDAYELINVAYQSETEVDWLDVRKFWLIVEDGHGFLQFHSFESHAELNTELHRRGLEFATWADEANLAD